MTYLGFDNDFSELSVAESDKIDFSIDYSNTSLTFLDGTAYNGTYKGPKQILTMEKQSGDNLTRASGFYECGSGTYRLAFPHKGTIKLTVAPATATFSSSGAFVTFYGDNEIAENVGDHPISGSQTFTFTGGQQPSGNVSTVSWTRGPNFGHNLSLYKVRYSCQNCFVSEATLTDQWIRDYIGKYSRERADHKQLILSDGQLAKMLGNHNHYSVYSTFGIQEGSSVLTVAQPEQFDASLFNDFINIYFPKFRDPCYSVWNITKIQNQECCGTEYQNTGGAGNDYICQVLEPREIVYFV